MTANFWWAQEFSEKSYSAAFRTFRSSGGWATTFGRWSSFFGSPSSVIEGAAKQHLDMCIETTELISRPARQRIVDGGINS